MTDRPTITATFDRIERDAGGWTEIEARDVCARVAEELRVPLDDVLAVMRDMLTGGAG